LPAGSSTAIDEKKGEIMLPTDPRKTALITGAAGVTGLATAKALKKDGYTVLLADIVAGELESKCSALGSAAHPVLLDVSNPEQVGDVSADIRKKFGPISVLVNNAGVLSNNKAEATTVEEWRRILSINLDGAFFLSREFLPAMKEMRWGRIVNVCSLAMKTGGLTAGTAYTASKGGLAALTFSLAREFAPFGVTVNGISPAYIKTPMITDFLTAAQRQRLLEQIPVGRFCKPEEVANVVRFLVSPLSGFITGEIVDINGGLQMD
jgi:3-oxoacyl-[acyl-carrier protein] reductase